MDKDFEAKVKGRRNKKRLAILIVILLLILFAAGWIWRGRGGAAKTGTATVEIRCDQLSEAPEALNDKALTAYVPEDGTIAAKTSYEIVPGETTAFDLTEQICKDQDIQIEIDGNNGYGMVYVKGINYLYEFSAGRYSGWMFTVNGDSPNYGADQAKLKDGDEVVWYYVIDYNKEG